MADVLTIARPYANAIFELALEEDKLKEWSDTLKLLGLIADDPAMRPVISNPLISKDQLVKLFNDVAGKLSEEANNLLEELAARKRLGIMPAISGVYENCLADRERTIDVKVVSAFPIDEGRLKKLQAALQGYLKRQVNMRFAVDRELIGGVVIYAGNQVIDASLRGKLNRLSERLCS
jgi:F-type H+-transporting ATPase subunit delta